MATKIFYNDNRIIIDGHADTPIECQAITAMCDEMDRSENFKTIVYEQGHAVFERVDGGDAMMFAMQDYVLTSRYDNETGYSAAVLRFYGKIHDRLTTIEEATVGYTNSSWLSNVIGSDYSDEYVDGERNPYHEAKGSIASRLDALEARLTKVLPFTADELIAKLESI